MEDFPNPERGFYRAAEVSTNNYEVLDVARMKTWRTLQQADDGNYKLYSSLVFRQIVLEGLQIKNFHKQYLKILQKICSNTGSRNEIMLRFCYTTTNPCRLMS
jgi:hypothetical protein